MCPQFFFYFFQTHLKLIRSTSRHKCIALCAVSVQGGYYFFCLTFILDNQKHSGELHNCDWGLRSVRVKVNEYAYKHAWPIAVQAAEITLQSAMESVPLI